MRTISYTSRFKRDYKRLQSGIYAKAVTHDLPSLLQMLATDETLPVQFRDHSLTGEYNDSRDCHVRPDLVLICRKPDDLLLELVRIGTHSELF